MKYLEINNKEALKELDAILEETDSGIKERTRTMDESDIPEILTWGLRNRMWTWKSPAQRLSRICKGLGFGMAAVNCIILACADSLPYWLWLFPLVVIALAGIAGYQLKLAEQKKLVILRREYATALQESYNKVEQQIVIEKNADYKRKEYLVMLEGALEIEMGKLHGQDDEKQDVWERYW